MPAATPFKLVSSVLKAISESGGIGAYTSDSLRSQPRIFSIVYRNYSYNVWVYIWTLTHGGRSNLPEEFRIQLTSVSSPLILNPNGLTVLLGYFPDMDIFGGFDISKHKNFTPGSPSLQISRLTFYEALQNGFSFSKKENDEIVIAFRPDQFLNYVLTSRNLHKYGKQSNTFKVLESASQSHPIKRSDLNSLSKERQKIINQVSSFIRDANFRQQVITAYGYRCAITRIQLGLVEAAHILPVSVKGSIDHVTNGIALSPNMHRAFDNSLIFFDESYIVRINNTKMAELSSVNQLGGIKLLEYYANKKIHLPADPNQYPNPEFIKMANSVRLIQI